MKKIKKLTLKKEAVTNLQTNEMQHLKGGNDGYTNSLTCATQVNCPTQGVVTCTYSCGSTNPTCGTALSCTYCP